MDIFKTFQKLKDLYPEDIARIQAEEENVKALLKKKQFAHNDGTKEMIALCRENIIEARKKLATDKTLLGNESAQMELWFIIESRQWVLDMVSRDYDTEIESIERSLESEL